jgi:hypothetical protein
MSFALVMLVLQGGLLIKWKFASLRVGQYFDGLFITNDKRSS